MVRNRNPMGLAEALALFNFSSGCEVTEKIIKQKYRELRFAIHPDKNKNISNKKAGELGAKYDEGKNVLLENIGAIKREGGMSSAKETTVGTVFVDYLKTTDIKNRKSPFTVYKKGKGK